MIVFKILVSIECEILFFEGNFLLDLINFENILFSNYVGEKVNFLHSGLCYDNLGTALGIPIEVRNEFECKAHCLKNTQCKIFTIINRKPSEDWCMLYPKLEYNKWKAWAANKSYCTSFYLEEFSQMIKSKEGLICIS